jgi:hypothetical protein
VWPGLARASRSCHRRVSPLNVILFYFLQGPCIHPDYSPMFLGRQEEKCTYFRRFLEHSIKVIGFLQKLFSPHDHALFSETCVVFIFHIPRLFLTLVHKIQQPPTPNFVAFGMGGFLRFFVFLHCNF